MVKALSLRFRQLARDERGTSIIELAFLAPILLVLVGGMIDVSMGLSARFSLQQAMGRSLELVQARPPQAGADDSDISYEYIRTEAATAAGAGSTVTLTRWVECNQVRNNDYSATCNDGQETARYLEINIKKNFVGALFLKTRAMEAEGTVRVQ